MILIYLLIYGRLKKQLGVRCDGEEEEEEIVKELERMELRDSEVLVMFKKGNKGGSL